MSKKLYIFNPDTDFALAAKSDFYTPPRKVSEFREEMGLFPATYASAGDGILLIGDYSKRDYRALPYYDIAEQKGLRIVIRPEVESGANLREYSASPWGWNRVIRRYLADNFPSLSSIPTVAEIDRIKELSHRRLTIPFHRLMCSALTADIPEPIEFFDADCAVEYYYQHKDIFFKTPWSSSGRGVIRTNDLEERHVRPWVSGAISNQGSVMGEIAQDKALDFATEWMCQDGEVRFLGYSVFETSRRGKYKGNIDATQAELRQMIEKAAPGFGEDIINMQQMAIATLIAKNYNGPLGIDMLATTSGKVNACVEINLRMTMGLCRLL
jgi:hypothetical protein